MSGGCRLNDWSSGLGNQPSKRTETFSRRGKQIDFNIDAKLKH